MSMPTKILRAPPTASALAATQTSWVQRQQQQCPEPTTTTTSTSTQGSTPSHPPMLDLPRSPVTLRLRAPNRRGLPAVWFSANFPRQSKDLSQPLGSDPEKPPDERKIKLGKTLRILQDRLPTLLQTPLPQDVLSPHITLHLFPSTHPHLPAVTGRVAYMAALWSSPIAWNRVPIVGNVRLEILSERMVAQPVRKRPAAAVGEQLVVRWRTAGSKGNKNWGLPFFLNGGSGSSGSAGGKASQEGEYKAPVGDAQAVGDSGKKFTGLFIFDFDGEGRILSHMIEHAQEGGQWERGVGAKVVGLTDWLLGGMKGSDESPCPAFTRKGR